MTSEDHRGSSESQSFYKDVFEYVQKNMSLEELLSLLTEDEPWENLVTEANLSREEADGLSECLIKLLTILNRKNQEGSQKYQQKKQRFLKEFPQDGLVGSPCCPRDSQESSPTPHFRSIDTSALSLLYGSTLTSKHDY